MVVGKIFGFTDLIAMTILILMDIPYIGNFKWIIILILGYKGALSFF